MEICREALERRQEGKAGMGAGHKDHGRTILGMPLGLYLGVLALTSVCMYMGCVPKSLVPAFLVLMVFGEGLNAIGNTVPVVKTYLGGSVICTWEQRPSRRWDCCRSRRMRPWIFSSMTAGS